MWAPFGAIGRFLSPTWAKSGNVLKTKALWRMLRIGELAQELDTTTKTIRHYERVGLLEPPVRTESGYRMYGAAAIGRARLVVGLRRLGLSVDQVRSILNDGDKASTLRQRLLGILDQQLAEIGLSLSVLQGRQEDLASRYHALLSTPRDRPSDCVCDALMIPCTCGRSESSQ